MLGAQQLERAAQGRGVGHVGIDDEETPDAGVMGPVADLLDEFDEGPRLDRYRARPAPAVAERAAIGKRRQSGNFGAERDGGAEAVGEDSIHAAAHMRSVLLGGADREDRRLAGAAKIARKLRPCPLSPLHGYSTLSVASVSRGTIG